MNDATGVDSVPSDACAGPRNAIYLLRWTSLMTAVALATSVGFATSAVANEMLLLDAGGSPASVQRGVTTVRLESERVTITLLGKVYEVDATFVFSNPGKAVEATLGFPRWSRGYLSYLADHKSEFAFETWVDGAAVPSEEVPGWLRVDGEPRSTDSWAGLDRDKDGGANVERLGWLVKKVEFRGGGKTTTRVRYRAPVGNSHEVEYLFGTGRTWEGTIGEATFAIRGTTGAWMYRWQFVEPGRQIGGEGPEKRRPDVRRVSDEEADLVLHEFKPDEREVLRVWTTDYLEPWWGEWQSNSSETVDPTGEEYSDAAIPDDLLKVMSCRHLGHFRNSFFARHGRTFRDKELDAYFRRFDWYHPRADFRESDLTPVESGHVRRIANFEKEVACSTESMIADPKPSSGEETTRTK